MYRVIKLRKLKETIYIYIYIFRMCRIITTQLKKKRKKRMCRIIITQQKQPKETNQDVQNNNYIAKASQRN